MTYNRTPSEKAKELINKHVFIDFSNNNNNDLPGRHLAKRCALMLVEEILDIAHLNTIAYSNYADGEIVEYTERVYWQEVKKHIEEII